MIAEIRGSDACSTMRLRRFAAGELRGAEADTAREHLAVCQRCQAVQREIEDERARLARDVPFEAFANGVAEKLARPPPRRTWLRFVPAAAAAAVLLVAVGTRIGREEPGLRSKGGASMVLYQRNGPSAVVLAPDAKAGEGAIAVQVSGAAFAAILLQEPGETSLLYSGEARRSVEHPFEWIGAARHASLVVVVSDRPLDGETVRAAVARNGPEAVAKGAQVMVRQLERAAR
jgi:hypothetical protein